MCFWKEEGAVISGASQSGLCISTLESSLSPQVPVQLPITASLTLTLALPAGY